MSDFNCECKSPALSFSVSALAGGEESQPMKG